MPARTFSPRSNTRSPRRCTYPCRPVVPTSLFGYPHTPQLRRQRQASSEEPRLVSSLYRFTSYTERSPVYEEPVTGRNQDIVPSPPRTSPQELRGSVARRDQTRAPDCRYCIYWDPLLVFFWPDRPVAHWQFFVSFRKGPEPILSLLPLYSQNAFPSNGHYG